MMADRVIRMTKPTCYYHGTCKDDARYEVWFEDSGGTVVFSRLCASHYTELHKEHKFDYVFDIEDL